MIELAYIALGTPIIIMVWVALVVVCRMAWRDFFND